MANPKIELQTNLGRIVLELWPGAAPKTVENFIGYVNAKHYEGTIFHRVIAGFMVQGGGFDQIFNKKSVHTPIANEADNGKKNIRGTVAMARTSDPNSATAQFFINLVDNVVLDHVDKSQRGWGYTVFGQVTSGMDVIDKIAAGKTGSKGPFDKDAPLVDVVIEQAVKLA